MSSGVNRLAEYSSVGMVLLSITSLQSGTALAVLLFATSGVVVTTFLRNFMSMLVLWAITRPDVRRYTRQHWRYAALLGGVTALMNLSFFAAVDRIPMGIVVAIDFLGPITVAVVKSRRLSHLVWPALAYSGVLMLTPLGNMVSLDALGVLLSLCAALGWALYILLTARTSALFGSTAGLTLATTFGSIALLPVLILGGNAHLFRPSTLLLGLCVALLSTTLPFALEFKVLRSMSERRFGVLLSIEPAVAAMIGMVFIGQALSLSEWLALGLVICAAVGVASTPKSGDEVAPVAAIVPEMPLPGSAGNWDIR